MLRSERSLRSRVHGDLIQDHGADQYTCKYLANERREPKPVDEVSEYLAY